MPLKLENRTVKIVPRTQKEYTWSGFVRYQKCKDYIAPKWDKTGTMVTGLTIEEEKEFEELLRKPAGELSKYSPFWHDYHVIMTDKDKVLDLNKPEDLLAYKFLLADPYIANSWHELQEGLWPDAKYVITDDLADAQIKNEEYDLKIKANLLFSKLSINQMTQILKLYSGNINMENVPADLVKQRLFEAMEKDVEKFIQLVEDKTLETKLMINQLVALKELRKNRSAYYYGDDLLGHDLDSTAAFIDNPENQGLKIAFKQKLESRKK